jgi:serine/threonine protein phosphatase PrpC
MVINHLPTDDDAPTRSFWFHAAGRTHPGAVRTTNEDAWLDRPEAGLWAVADGMGGYQAGDVASGEVVDALRKLAERSRGLTTIDDVVSALQSCNDDLRGYEEREPYQRMGSTVVCLLLSGRCFSCAWAGDSRLYRLRRGELEQLTRDHSYVQELIDAGHIDRAHARGHPQANAITQAVGVMQHLEPEVLTGVIEEGDLFLLCSDGLTKTLDEHEIADVLARETPEAAVDELLRRSLDRGARDNVTLVTIQCDPIVRRS